MLLACEGGRKEKRTDFVCAKRAEERRREGRKKCALLPLLVLRFPCRGGKGGKRKNLLCLHNV